MHFADLLVREIGQEQSFAIARDLHASYSPFMQDLDVRHLLRTVLPSGNNRAFDVYFETVGAHRIVSDLVMALYPSEKTIKYYMTRERLCSEDEIAAFEVKVDNSRLDFGVINGNSYAFEIKTELDNLNKLEKQVLDYSRVFEYVSVVIHPCHLEKVAKSIPDFCGIRVYRLTNEGCTFKTVRRSLRSPSIEYSAQIANLTSRELEWVLRTRGHSEIPGDRARREEMVWTSVPKSRINAVFKKTLKHRFKSRWEHVKLNFDQINPVDVQAFFNSMSDPKWVYYRNSSMV